MLELFGRGVFVRLTVEPEGWNFMCIRNPSTNYPKSRFQLFLGFAVRLEFRVQGLSSLNPKPFNPQPLAFKPECVFS